MFKLERKNGYVIVEDDKCIMYFDGRTAETLPMFSVTDLIKIDNSQESILDSFKAMSCAEAVISKEDNKLIKSRHSMKTLVESALGIS